MALIAQLPQGRLETFDAQEVKHASDIPDPPKYRFSIPLRLLGPGSLNLGALTGNTEREPTPENPHGELDERGSAGFRSLGDGRWAFFVSVQYREGEDPQEVLLVTSDGIYGNEEFKGRFVGATASPARPPALLRAPGGECELHIQGDGNLVVYDTRRGSPNEGNVVPIWSSGSVMR